MKLLKVFTALMLLSNMVSAQWQTVYYPYIGKQLPWLNALEFRDFTNGIAVGIGEDRLGCILRTDDNGNNWDTVYTAIDSMAFWDVTIADSAKVVAVGARYYCCGSSIGLIAKSEDFGNTWTTTSTGFSLIKLFFPSPSVGYILGDSGIILKTITGGNSWVRLNSTTASRLSSICFINDSIGFVSGRDTILKTSNGGISWASYSIATNYFEDIFFASDSVGYCIASDQIGTNKKVYKTTDQGNTWVQMPNFPNIILSVSLFFNDEDTGYAAGKFKISKTTDGGLTWNNQTSSLPSWTNFYDDLFDIYMLSADTGFAIGNRQFYRIPADTTPIYGCPDTGSINYNPFANYMDSCIPKIYGCMDTASINYNPLANVNDGNCITRIYGCTDTSAVNYNPSANTSDGSCIPKVYGLTDTACINYNMLANTNSGVCVQRIYGCTNPAALNYNPQANTDDGSCIASVYGCTDSTAENFNPLANVDDGSCIFTGIQNSGGNGISIQVIPNPFSKQTTFHVEGLEFEIGTIKIFSQLGELIDEITLNKGKSLYTYQNDKLGLGIFIYLISADNKYIKAGKLVVA